MKEQHLSGGSGMVYNADCTITYTSNPFAMVNGNAVGISGTSTGTYITNTIISDTLSLTNNMNKVNNQFVAIFKIERNDKNEITSAKFIKEMWIETKNGSSVDFEVAKDPEISKYKAEEIAIKTIYTVSF
jgi:hypothetical protein